MDKQTIVKIAKLSKLNLSEDEINLYLSQFQDILKYMEQLAEVDTNNIEPYMTPITDNLREDEFITKDILDKTIALNMAKHHDDNYYIVPKVSLK